MPWIAWGFTSFITFNPHSMLRFKIIFGRQVGRMGFVPAYVSCSKPSLHGQECPWEGALCKWLSRSASDTMHVALYKWSIFKLYIFNSLNSEQSTSILPLQHSKILQIVNIAWYSLMCSFVLFSYVGCAHQKFFNEGQSDGGSECFLTTDLWIVLF